MQTFVPKNTTPVQAIRVKNYMEISAGSYLLIEGDDLRVVDKTTFESQYAPEPQQAAHKDGKRTKAPRDPVDQRLTLLRILADGQGRSESYIRDHISPELRRTRGRMVTTLGQMNRDKLVALDYDAGKQEFLYRILDDGHAQAKRLEALDAKRIERAGLSGAR